MKGTAIAAVSTMDRMIDMGLLPGIGRMNVDAMVGYIDTEADECNEDDETVDSLSRHENSSGIGNSAVPCTVVPGWIGNGA